jgi:hypothetical protein
MEPERTDSWTTSWVGTLFDYHPPRCGFSRSEQRMLLTALEGGTDRELSRKQKRLLKFRFQRFASLEFQRIPGPAQLRARGRDLYEALALPVADDKSLCERLLSLMVKQDDFNRESWSPAQAAVLCALFVSVHFRNPLAMYPVSHVTNLANLSLAPQNEKRRLTPHAVGRLLTSLGFANRTRKNNGCCLIVDNELRRKVHISINRYGLKWRELIG